MRGMYIRYHSTFFVQIWHETTYASSGNHDLFTVSCQHQASEIIGHIFRNESIVKIKVFKSFLKNHK